MNTQSRVELLRLHCQHLRTLIDYLITEVTTMGHALAVDGSASDGVVATHLNEVEQQSAHIALEITRLQGFVHALDAKRMDAPDAAVESPQAPSPALDTAEK
jgi:hypothetical protein